MGEVGLDYTTSDENLRKAQREVFGSVLELCANAGDKVLTVHSRRAAADVISMIGTSYPCSAILHWFSGTPRQLEQAMSAGLYFSVNAPMVRSKKGQDLVARMHPDYVLTESDGPFARVSGAPANPSGIADVVSHLADLWGSSYVAAKARVLANFQRAMGTEVAERPE